MQSPSPRRDKSAIDLTRQPFQGFIEKIDLCQDLLDEKGMMRFEAPLQGAVERGQLLYSAPERSCSIVPIERGLGPLMPGQARRKPGHAAKTHGFSHRGNVPVADRCFWRLIISASHPVRRLNDLPMERGAFEAGLLVAHDRQLATP